MNPRVTVLMCVYNGERFLREAIESILLQSFSDFEFLIIDDGSTDSSVDIIRSYPDARIKLVCNKRNMGLTFSLNKGLALSQGEYIVRMDADDVSLPERFKKQVAYMDANSDVGVCGSWLETCGTRSPTLWRSPVEDAKIRCELIFHSAIYHPTVILRKVFFNENKLLYDERMFFAEDYDLWVRASKFMRLANISEKLLLYRMHDKNVGNIFAEKQHQSTRLIWNRQIMELGIEPLTHESEIHSKISLGKFGKSKSFVNQAEQWILKLQRANNRWRLFPEPIFSEGLAIKWFKLCYAASNLGFWSFKTFWKSPLRHHIHFNRLIKNKLKQFI